MRFPYQHYRTPPSLLDGSEELWRPEIPLHLIGKTGGLFTYGLLDSGADGVLISRSIADDVGIGLEETSRWPVRGVSGESLEAVLGHVEVEVMDQQDSVCWRMPVGVVTFDDPANDDIILLGQTGFLPFFDTRFFGADHFVELVPNGALPKRTDN
jgi:hypothetical protein